jgi:hypothetical protein
MRQPFTLVLLMLLGIATAACNQFNSPQSIALGAGPQSWIDAPPDASALPLAPYKIISHSSDFGGIAQIEVSVNGAVLVTKAGTGAIGELVTANQIWTPPSPGNYTLQVRAQNSGGVWGGYAQAVVIVGQTAPPPPPTFTPTPAPTVIAISTATPTSLPNVTIRFVADDNSLFVGECANLNWAVTNVSQVLLDDAPVNLTGTKQVCPRLTTTYKLRITTLDRQTTERTLTINVTAAPTRTFTPIIPTRTPTRVPTTPAPTGCSGAPVISTFAASPGTINAGGTSQLSWGAVTNADSVELDHGIGGVGAPGSTNVSPSSTTTYTLTAHCKGTPATRAVTVIVNPAPSGPTIGAPTFFATQLMYANSPACTPSRTARVQVTISASDPNGVANVTMYYRFADSSNSTSYSSVPMASSAGNWTYLLNAPNYPTVPSLNTNTGTIQFYFIAADTGGATSRSPDYNNNVSLVYCR